jgi:hypothetical protein
VSIYIDNETGKKLYVIELTQGVRMLVDEEDYYGEVGKLKWFAGRDGRRWTARRAIYENYGKGIELAHRRIMHAAKSQEIDHITHHDLEHRVIDNRTLNLRIATRSQNGANRRKQDGLSSIYKGVHWSRLKNKWVAAVRCKDKRYNLGVFSVERDAALAYDVVASHLFGKNALLNLPDSESPFSVDELLKPKAYSSPYRGVRWVEPNHKWRVNLIVNGKLRHIGYYTDEIEAARAYDRAALELLGHKAKLNFPESSQ